MDESEILNDARLYDELEANDDGRALNSDSWDSGEEEFDEGADVNEVVSMKPM